MRYVVRDYFCAHTDNHSSTGYYSNRRKLLLSRFPWELTDLPWRLQGFTPWFETQPQPPCLFESHGDPQISYQYKAFDEYSKIDIFQHCFLFIFFADICGLINHSISTLNAFWHVYWCIGMGLKKIVVQNSIKVYRNRIKISKMV